MNVITLLTKDHRKVESLFERYRGVAKADAKKRLLDQISRELSLHMSAEERELYPLLRSEIPDGSSLMSEAETEHSQAKALIADLVTATEPATFDMDAKVATLMKAIEHHVSEEEGEVFPKMKERFDRARLEDIGAKVMKAKRSAPALPPRSAARRSPGPSLRGVAAAATDRVRTLFTPSGDAGSERKSPKRARQRRKPARRKTTTAAKAKRTKRSRARRRA